MMPLQGMSALILLFTTRDLSFHGNSESENITSGFLEVQILGIIFMNSS